MNKEPFLIDECKTGFVGHVYHDPESNKPYHFQYAAIGDDYKLVRKYTKEQAEKSRQALIETFGGLIGTISSGMIKIADEEQPYSGSDSVVTGSGTIDSSDLIFGTPGQNESEVPIQKEDYIAGIDPYEQKSSSDEVPDTEPDTKEVDQNESDDDAVQLS